MYFLDHGWLKTKFLCVCYTVVFLKIIKICFFHPIWYDLAVMELLSTNSVLTFEWLGSHFPVQKPKQSYILNNITVLMSICCQNLCLSIQNVTFCRIYFCYAAYSVIYSCTLENVLLMLNRSPVFKYTQFNFNVILTSGSFFYCIF